jgi:hypothetical protein
MALPLLAPTMVRRMHPRDVLDIYPVLNQGDGLAHILQPDEIVTSFSVTLTAEAAAVGMVIATGEDAPRYAALVFALQVSILPARRSSSIFDGAGVTVGVEINFATNLCNREKTYTHGIKVVRK